VRKKYARSRGFREFLRCGPREASSFGSPVFPRCFIEDDNGEDCFLSSLLVSWSSSVDSMISIWYPPASLARLLSSELWQWCPFFPRLMYGHCPRFIAPFFLHLALKANSPERASAPLLPGFFPREGSQYRRNSFFHTPRLKKPFPDRHSFGFRPGSFCFEG